MIVRRFPLVLAAVVIVAAAGGAAVASPAASRPCVAYDGAVFNAIRDHGVADGTTSVRLFPLHQLGVKVPGGWLIAAQVSASKQYGWGVWSITKNPPADPLSGKYDAAAWGSIYSVNRVAKAHTTFRAWPRQLPTGATARAVACGHYGR